VSKPLAIDLFCGLGGWTEGFLAEGYDVIGFDIERRTYPAQLVLQDVLTLHGSQFRNAAIIVASPPCQAYSYRAMPWKWAWVGRAKWHYGSFYLWGDVPALMPFASGRKVPIQSWSDYGKPGYKAQGFNTTADQRLREATKNDGGSWFNQAHNTESGTGQNPDGRKLPNGNCRARRFEDRPIKRLTDASGTWFDKGDGKFVRSDTAATSGSKRKLAAAQIAKIPFELARHIAAVFKPLPGSNQTRTRMPVFNPEI